MDCAEIREFLSPYIDGELPAEDARKVREHLERCPECRRLHAELEEGWRLMAAAPVPEISPDFNARFWKRLRAAKGIPEAGAVIRAMPLRLKLRRVVGYAAAALVLIVLGLYIALRGTGDGETGQLSREEAEIVENLDVLESLDIVQDLEVIENLDILTELDETDFENL